MAHMHYLLQACSCGGHVWSWHGHPSAHRCYGGRSFPVPGVRQAFPGLYQQLSPPGISRLAQILADVAGHETAIR